MRVRGTMVDARMSGIPIARPWSGLGRLSWDRRSIRPRGCCDLLSTHATQIEKVPRCGTMGGDGPRELVKLSAPGTEEQRVRVTICDGGEWDARAAPRRDRPADFQDLAGNPLHLRRMMHPPR